MKVHHKRPIKYKKERVILSDVLPFEIPVTYSNRHLYDFLIKNKVELVENKLKWKCNDPTINQVIKLLFDFRDSTIITNELIIEKPWKLKTIPFTYKISHKENDFRELSIAHPKNQLSLIQFYEKNKHLILHYCSLSPFSIRSAHKIAKFVYHNDKTHKQKLSTEQEYESTEEFDKEYESLKTFFVYRYYSNIHKFYESYKYHQCEKKYNKLFKFDISKCFDSIYSHSITWALLNKAIVKETLGSSRSCDSTFGGEFDKIMQNLNYGETNGIIIGPEFSRIFAELILQKVDSIVESTLKENESFIHKKDYEIFRYVDDYFVFYNAESTKDTILKHFRLQLKEFKLSLNDSKTQLYEKPIITGITIAKQRIGILVDKYISYKKDENEIANQSTSQTASMYVSSNRIITKFKTVLKEANVEYKDILNYTLAVIERKFTEIIKKYTELESKKNSEKIFTRAILEILDFTFFLYSVSPKVNTTIKLCRILRKLTELLKSKDGVNIDFKHQAFKKIYDNIYFILQKNKTVEHTQVETLYLLIALSELGKKYWLDIEVLRQYVCIEKDHAGRLFVKNDLNYFVIVVVLFYMQNKKRYLQIREFIKQHIKYKFLQASKENMGKNSELVFLLFDVLTCPYLELDFKKDILAINDIADVDLQLNIINIRKYWFTKWTNFDFGKELDAKQSQEVY